MLKLWSYLKPCQTTLSMLSSEKVSCYRISVNYFRKKAPLQMFDLFITTPLLTILHDSLLRTTFCRKERLKSKGQEFITYLARKTNASTIGITKSISERIHPQVFFSEECCPQNYSNSKYLRKSQKFFVMKTVLRDTVDCQTAFNFYHCIWVTGSDYKTTCLLC